MPNEDRNFEKQSLEAPAKLAAALKEIPREEIFIPRSVDEAVLRAARQHLERAQPRRVGWFQLMPCAVAVAMLALLLLLAQLFIRQSAKTLRSPVFAREDVNHDGRVDILDAFVVARQLKSGAASSAQLDLNGDGVVDDRDVRVIAHQAVKLEKGGRS